MAVASRKVNGGLYASRTARTAQQPRMVTVCAGDYQDGMITPEAYARFAAGWARSTFVS